jgi:hypothetical protein
VHSIADSAFECVSRPIDLEHDARQTFDARLFLFCFFVEKKSMGPMKTLRNTFARVSRTFLTAASQRAIGLSRAHVAFVAILVVFLGWIANEAQRTVVEHVKIDETRMRTMLQMLTATKHTSGRCSSNLVDLVRPTSRCVDYKDELRFVA